jgi:urease gamma subunit
MEQVRSYGALMQRVIAALTTDKAGTIAALAKVVTELSEKARNVTGRMQRGEDVPLDEALDVEQIATQAAASNLMCEASDSPDPILFGEGQMRAEAIASMLDQILEAYRDGDPQRMDSLRQDVGVSLESFAALVRGSDAPP